MTDPAIAAAQRATAKDGGFVTTHDIAAAREALAPVRLWYESNKEFLDAGYPISLDGLAKLIYPESEL